MQCYPASSLLPPLKLGAVQGIQCWHNTRQKQSPGGCIKPEVEVGSVGFASLNRPTEVEPELQKILEQHVPHKQEFGEEGVGDENLMRVEHGVRREINEFGVEPRDKEAGIFYGFQFKTLEQGVSHCRAQSGQVLAYSPQAANIPHRTGAEQLYVQRGDVGHQTWKLDIKRLLILPHNQHRGYHVGDFFWSDVLVKEPAYLLQRKFGLQGRLERDEEMKILPSWCGVQNWRRGSLPFTAERSWSRESGVSNVCMPAMRLRSEQLDHGGRKWVGIIFSTLGNNNFGEKTLSGFPDISGDGFTGKCAVRAVLVGGITFDGEFESGRS
ncbi:hypothetical protein C8R47DRAFT_1084627 [Mycena vitilis]|nr:hypothetical protein C8R47DRAFT_1084627 [Mycena vitilis]